MPENENKLLTQLKFTPFENHKKKAARKNGQPYVLPSSSIILWNKTGINKLPVLSLNHANINPAIKVLVLVQYSNHQTALIAYFFGTMK